MKYKTIAARIIELRRADLALRDILLEKGLLSHGYNQEMNELHDENAEVLDQIIEEIGYPTVDKVGEEAHDAAWLVIQHAIGQPGFMKKCAVLLGESVREHRASPNHLAYLSDRIAVFEGRPQLYGTQYDWDEHGQMSPNEMDDLDSVNQRRKSIGMAPMEEHTALMRQRASKENDSAPLDYDKQKAERDKWRKAVGWISS